MTMTDAERKAYDAHMDDIMVQNDVLDTAKMEGRAEGKIEMAKNLKSLGVDIRTIMQASGLTEEQIKQL